MALLDLSGFSFAKTALDQLVRGVSRCWERTRSPNGSARHAWILPRPLRSLESTVGFGRERRSQHLTSFQTLALTLPIGPLSSSISTCTRMLSQLHEDEIHLQ